MSDIFISYARWTEAHARQFADALRALGYGVWRDDEPPAHRAYADAIEERLEPATGACLIHLLRSGRRRMSERKAVANITLLGY